MADNARMVAVCSRDKPKADAFAARHGAERSYDSFDDILADPEVEVVHIATPNHMHSEQTIRAAQAGKHVLCEKPMALSVHDAELMIEACRKCGVKLGVGFQNRHHPAHRKARNLILSGAVGEIMFASVQYSRWQLDRGLTGWRADPGTAGGGILMGAGLHAIDLLRFLVGKEVEEVLAATDEGQPNRPVEEIALSTLKLRDGPYCTAASGRHIPRAYNDFVVYGTAARITGVGTVGTQLKGELRIDGDSLISKMEFPSDVPIYGCYRLQVEAFNRCIEEDCEPNASGVDGLEMVRIAEAVLESGRQHRAVTIPTFL